MIAAAASLFIGALASQGLGEQRVSGLAALEAGVSRVHVSARFDSSRKVESGRGWIGTAEVQGRAGALRLGVAAVHREAGTWSKRTLWAEPGVAWGPVEVALRGAVAGDTAGERGGRVRLTWGRLRYEGQVLRHHGGAWGRTSALMLALR